MKRPRNLIVDGRRRAELLAQLKERARAWIPGWEGDDDRPDVARTILEIAARFGSEVTERLDRMQEKNARGLLDWLGVKPRGARPARMPVVFQMTDSARESVFAAAPVKMQAETEADPQAEGGPQDGSTVIFETERDIRVSPARLDLVVAAEPGGDAFYLPAPGLTTLGATDPVPTEWSLLSFAANGATKLQLSPELGLAPGLVLSLGGKEYRVTAVDRTIVTIEPPLEAADGLDGGTVASKVTTFAPFSETARNRQEHVLYIGDENVLNIEAEASIRVVGVGAVPPGTTWQYWGKAKKPDADAEGSGDPQDQEPAWRELTPDLADSSSATAVALLKPKGSIDMRQIDGQPGVPATRWIRATVPTVSQGVAPIDELRLAINCVGDGSCGDCPDTAATADAAPVVEGFSNTNPQVVNQSFFPFGQEPRQFDAFYLGCKEAFSKTDAHVCLCFAMAVPKIGPLAVARPDRDGVAYLFGVGQDGSLHCLKLDTARGVVTEFHPSVQPPSPSVGGGAVADARVRLEEGLIEGELRPRPTAWIDEPSGDLHVAVWSGTDVWLWYDAAAVPTQSGWRNLGAAGGLVAPMKHVEALAHYGVRVDRGGMEMRVLALRDGKLYSHGTGSVAGWTQVGPKEKSVRLRLASVIDVPVFQAELFGAGSPMERVVMTEGGKLYGGGRDADVDGPDPDEISKLTNGWQALRIEENNRAIPLDALVRPAAVRFNNDGQAEELIVVAKRSTDAADPQQLVVFRSKDDSFESDVSRSLKLEGRLVGSTLDLAVDKHHVPVVIATVKMDDGSTTIMSWVPNFEAVTQDNVFYTDIPATLGKGAEVPVFAGNYLIVPNEPRDVLVTAFTPSSQAFRIVPPGDTGQGLIIEPAALSLEIGDSVGALFENAQEVVEGAGVRLIRDARTVGGRTLYRLNGAFDEDLTSAMIYRTSEAGLDGEMAKRNELTLADEDLTQTEEGVWLVIGAAPPARAGRWLRRVEAISSTTPRVATLNSGVPRARTLQVQYWHPTDVPAPFALPVTTLQLNSVTGNWSASLLESQSLLVPRATPKLQPALVFESDGAGHPVVIALAKTLGKPVPATAQGVRFAINLIEDWSRQLADTSSNPELSWEYWNGTGWWRLTGLQDATGHLKSTGMIHFDVPDDFAESDWAGRSNFWIRARLVGGDYGREVVMTVDDVGPGDKPIHVVQRNTDKIHPPYVMQLQVSYSICDAVVPQYVLTSDSGTTTDQSAANRTPGAVVRAFVPLSESLGALERAGADEGSAPDDYSDCGCKGGAESAATTPPTTSADSSAPSANSPRALYLGFTRKLEGEALSFLLTVNERNHDEFAPAIVEVLRNGRFEAVTSDDETRAAGETGAIGMVIPRGPTAATLFGESRFWLRVRPTGAVTTDWQPDLTGAYINATWAGAAETQELEMLGSSDGAPNQRFLLARPPVMEGTLVLRVLEPLGEEERAALLAGNDQSVRSDISGHPGDWVLWNLVADPLDEAATSRCASLEEDSGEIRFGNGTNGRIPPIGRDSIMAVSYRRSESSAANRVAQWANLNLITPIDGVEASYAPTRSAGGSDSDTPERVLERGAARLRYRARAVTGKDLEDIALDFSPDIAQAKYLVGRSGARLIIVMRGPNPTPNRETRRALRTLLLESAAPELARRDRLSVEPATLRKFGVSVRLDVADLRASGKVAIAARRQIARFFDAARGGASGSGWPLGSVPQDADIAASVLDVPALETTSDVDIYGLDELSRRTAWRGTVRADEFAWLPPDGIEVRIGLLEATP